MLILSPFSHKAEPGPRLTRDYLKGLKLQRTHLNLLAELKPPFLKSFQGSQKQFQSKRLVMLRMDVYVPANLYQAKRLD